MHILLLLRYRKANRCLLLKRQIVPHRLQEKWVHNFQSGGPGQHQVLSGGKNMGKTLHCGFSGKELVRQGKQVEALGFQAVPGGAAWPWCLGLAEAGLE